MTGMKNVIVIELCSFFHTFRCCALLRSSPTLLATTWPFSTEVRGRIVGAASTTQSQPLACLFP